MNRTTFHCSLLAIPALVLGTATLQAAVDTTDRAAVLAFYQAQYMPVNPPAIGFTGDTPTCNAGTTSADFRAAVARRVNFFRGMAGLADSAVDDMLSAQAQQTALLEAVNWQANGLSHTPPNSWACYSDVGGATAARSNLSGGSTGWNAIDAYVNEDGVLGHRRWVLYTNLGSFGTGDVPAGGMSAGANALYVIGTAPSSNATPRDGFVAWPPKGYLPYKLAYGVWSFSVPGADFSGTTATMTDPMGNAVMLNSAGGLANGYADNTFAFTPNLPNTLPGGGRVGPRPIGGGPDLTYQVTINNVKVNGASQNYNYSVTLVDVNDPITDMGLFIPFINSQVSKGTKIGLIRATDPNPDPNPTYKHTLVAGDGADDNALFTIDNDCQLIAAADLDFGMRAYKIRVRVDNGHPGGTFEKAIVVNPFML